jgi:tetratricopeptide (TPR) repeat protein
MIPRILTVIFLCALAAAAAVAQKDVVVATVSGRVFADGRPVSKTVQIRLERQDSSLIGYAYTLGSQDFEFRNVSLRANEKSYLVINEPGYKELRYAFELNGFRFDPLAKLYINSGMFELDLKSLPQEKTGLGPSAGSKVVDIRQLLNPIPDKAQRECDLAAEGLARGDAETAIHHLEKAVELAPEYYDAVNELGAEYLKAGRYEKAEAMLNRARALNPKDPIPLTNLGTLYFQEGERLSSAAAAAADGNLKPGEESFRKAVEVLESALQLDPQSPRSNFYLGTALYRIGDYERSESLLRNALSLNNGMQDARLSLLNLYIRQRRYDAALEQISIYLEANPVPPQRQQIERLRTQIESVLSQKDEH